MMKCKNCGAIIHNGITCEVCGHRSVGKYSCEVCGTRIVPGQDFCSSCGSPTVYRNNSNDETKKITPDTIRHSEASHSYDTVQESYDYKAEGYNYKEEAKKIFTRPNIQVSRKTRRTNNLLAIVIVLAVMITVGSTTLINFFDTSNDTVEVTGDLDRMTLTSDNHQTAINSNYKGDGSIFTYGKELYYCNNAGIAKYSSDFSSYKLMYEGYGIKDLYIDDEYVYCLDGNSFTRFDHKFDNTEVLLENIQEVYQHGDDVIYLSDENQLFYANINDLYNPKLIANEQVASYTVDPLNNRVVYCTDIDFQSRCVNYDGTNVIDLEVGGYDTCMFSDGLLYSSSYQGITVYDIDKQETLGLIEVADVYNFIMDDQQRLIVRTYDDYVSLVEYNDDYEVEGISDVFTDDLQVRSFYVAGEYVLGTGYDEDYNVVWYIGDESGNPSTLETVYDK